MKTKLINCLFALFLALFSFVQGAFAFVTSDAEIKQKINKLNVIMNTDYISFINKADVVGYRLSSFEMQNANYKNQARMNIENLNNILIQLNDVRNSLELSDTDKNMQVAKLYQQAKNILFGMDNVTMNYLMSLNTIMPTITYERFVKRFQDFYNGLNLTNADVKVK